MLVEFKDKIRAVRLGRGWTQARLARELEVAQPSVSQWENGRAIPTGPQIRRFEKKLDESLTQTFGEWLFQVRESRGMTRDVLAKQSGLSWLTVTNIEEGRTANPRAATVERLEGVLHERFVQPQVERSKRSAHRDGPVGELNDFNPHDDTDWPDSKTLGVFMFFSADAHPVYVGEGACIRKRVAKLREELWYRFPVIGGAAFVGVGDAPLRIQLKNVFLTVIGEQNLIFNGLPEEMGLRIRAARELRDWNQTVLASRMKVSQPLVSQWETGKILVGDDQVVNLETTLGMKFRERSFGDWLRETRDNQGLSRNELAGRAELSVPTIASIEEGKIFSPRDRTVRRLEVALDAAFSARHESGLDPDGESSRKVSRRTDFNPHDREDWPPPKKPGVYVFFSSDRHPEYIGQSDDVRRRLSQHEEKFWFRPPIVETACYFEILDKRLRLQMEAMLIRVIGEKRLILNKRTEST